MNNVVTPAQPQPAGEPAFTIDIVSDAVCPWCYIGKRNLEVALAKMPDLNAVVNWRPYQLDATIPAGGIDRQSYLARKFGDRVSTIYARVTEAGKAAGLDLAFDRIARSPNTLDAHRLIRWSWSAGAQDAIVERLFKAYFIDGEDIGDHDVLVGHAEAAGMDGGVVRRLLKEDTDNEVIRQEIDQARSLGVTGVPFYILDQKVGVSGAQPPAALEKAIRAAQGGVNTM